MSGLTTLDAAKGMQRRHTKLLRDIDRLRSILPPDFAATALQLQDSSSEYCSASM